MTMTRLLFVISMLVHILKPARMRVSHKIYGCIVYRKSVGHPLLQFMYTLNPDHSQDLSPYLSTSYTEKTRSILGV